MKHFRLLWALVLFAGLRCSTVQAQYSDFKGRFCLLGHLSLNPFNRESGFADFNDSYETSWKNETKSAFQNQGLPWSWGLAGQYWLTSNMGFQYAVRYSTHTQAFTFTSGEKRLETFRNRSPLEFGVLVGNPQRLYFNFAFGLMDSRMICAYEYADGTRSLSTEAYLNGVYSSFGFCYRLEAYMHIWKNLLAMVSLGGAAGSEYTDKSYIRGIDTRLGAYETTYFPADYELATQTIGQGQSYNYPTDKVVKLRQLSVSVGLSYRIPVFLIKM